MCNSIEERRQRAIEEYRRRIAEYQPPDLSWIPQFRKHVHATIASSPVPERLANTSAVILERIARGGGSTNWYYCTGTAQLEALEQLLHPGSCVSFYFDERIKRAPYSAETMKAIAASMKYPDQCFNLGTLRSDGITINMIISVDPIEFDEYDEEWSSAPFVFYGDFPARDNDGVKSVTLTIPDEDGIVRIHPY